jgi:ABC-2 type transport system permease protein
LLEAGLNLVPPAVFLLGVGAFTFGVWPRAAVLVTYGVLAWSFLVELIGGVVRANHWLLDTSVLYHMAPAPAVSPALTSSVVLSSLGIGLGVVGGACFRRRDIVLT